MGCRKCERTYKVVEDTWQSHTKHDHPSHWRLGKDSFCYMQQIQTSNCINGPGIGESCIQNAWKGECFKQTLKIVEKKSFEKESGHQSIESLDLVDFPKLWVDDHDITPNKPVNGQH